MNLYSHLTPRRRPTNRVGAAPPEYINTVGNKQQIRPEFAEAVKINLAAMYWTQPPQIQQVTGVTTYAALSPSRYQEIYGAPPPTAPGFPSNVSSTSPLAINASELAAATAVSGNINYLSVMVGDSLGSLLPYVQPGSDFAVLQPLQTGAPATAPAKKSNALALAVGAGLLLAVAAAVTS